MVASLWQDTINESTLPAAGMSQLSMTPAEDRRRSSVIIAVRPNRRREQDRPPGAPALGNS